MGGESRAYLLGVWRHSPPHRILHSPHSRSPGEQAEEGWEGAGVGQSVQQGAKVLCSRASGDHGG